MADSFTFRREGRTHYRVGQCSCGSKCHHGGMGGVNYDPDDLRWDPVDHRTYCVTTGEWLKFASTPEGEEYWKMVRSRSQRRGFQHRYASDERGNYASEQRGKRGFIWVTIRGKRMQIAVAQKPAQGRNTSREKSVTRRDRRVVREQAPAPARKRRGVVRTSTTKPSRVTGHLGYPI